MNNRRVLFRADGNHIIGLGHVVRSLALVEILSPYFNCAFAITDPSEELHQTIVNICPDIIILDKDNSHKAFLNFLTGNEIVVLDGYNFTSVFKKSIKEIGCKLVLIDDEVKDYEDADLIINHCSDLIKDLYTLGSRQILLLGLDYLILRRPFRSAALNSRTIDDRINSVFICMGGADPFNITIKALDACIMTNFTKTIFIVIGSAYSHKDTLRSYISIIGNDKKVTIYEDIPAEKIVRLINKSHISICTSSSIALEICSVKSGVLTGIVASNQQYIQENLLDKNCCLSIGNWHEASIERISDKLNVLNNPKLINNMMHNQHRAINGCSGNKLVNNFYKISCS